MKKLRDYLIGFVGISSLLIGGAFVEHHYRPLGHLSNFRAVEESGSFSFREGGSLDRVFAYGGRDFQGGSFYEVDADDIKVYQDNGDYLFNVEFEGRRYEVGVYTRGGFDGELKNKIRFGSLDGLGVFGGESKAF